MPKLISLAMNGSLAKADELIAKNKGADLDAAYIKVFFKAIRENQYGKQFLFFIIFLFVF